MVVKIILGLVIIMVENKLLYVLKCDEFIFYIYILYICLFYSWKEDLGKCMLV